jgi:hypothetical protein
MILDEEASVCIADTVSLLSKRCPVDILLRVNAEES